MNQITAAALPLALMAVFFVVPVYIIHWLRKRYRRDRRSPLTEKLLRGAGQTLRLELDRVEDDLSNQLAILLVMPFMMFSVYLSQSYFGGARESVFRLGLTAAIASAAAAFIARKLYLLSRRKFILRCGLEAEVAMGEELGHLMRRGAVVFHDFPAEQFNIDHVVLTAGGVYAVETKGRMKPDKGRGKLDATVEFDGRILIFPDWRDTKTVEQATRQAVWLANWISKAVGRPIGVKAVVALPGWWVERSGRGNAMVISGKEARHLLKPWQDELFTEQMMIQIAHQLEQRCRDVEPTQYGRQEGLIARAAQ